MGTGRLRAAARCNSVRGGIEPQSPGKSPMGLHDRNGRQRFYISPLFCARLGRFKSPHSRLKANVLSAEVLPDPTPVMVGLQMFVSNAQPVRPPTINPLGKLDS